MKKIAIVYSGGKNWGGIENYYVNLLQNKDPKVEFMLFSMGEWELTKKIKGKIEIQNLSASRINFFLPFSLRKYYKKEGIEAVLSQGVVSNFYARISSLFSGIPHITVVPSNLKNEYHKFFVRNLYLVIDIILSPISKKFIVISEYLKGELLKRGINRNKIEIIYYGLEPFTVKRKKRDEEIVVGSAGRLQKEKGYDVLIPALGLLPENYILNICGEGSERENLNQLIKKHGLGKRVNLLGFQDLKDFYSKIDVYVQPSRTEGFCVTAAEAMIATVPTVVGPNGALPEIARLGGGLIVDEFSPKGFADAIEKTLSSDAQPDNKELIKATDPKIWFEKTIAAILSVTK